MPTVSVQYFAILREQRGVSNEQLSTTATTPGEIYEELRTKHGFSLPSDRVRAAVNGDFVDSGSKVNDGDEIVFIPPVAGG
jgi:molybdopterin synthase sulfur carrier subunit